MKFQRCGRDVAVDEVFSHKGQTLCEDYYIDATSPESECDPWATYVSSHSAKM